VNIDSVMPHFTPLNMLAYKTGPHEIGHAIYGLDHIGLGIALPAFALLLLWWLWRSLV